MNSLTDAFFIVVKKKSNKGGIFVSHTCKKHAKSCLCLKGIFYELPCDLRKNKRVSLHNIYETNYTDIIYALIANYVYNYETEFQTLFMPLNIAECNSKTITKDIAIEIMTIKQIPLTIDKIRLSPFHT